MNVLVVMDTKPHHRELMAAKLPGVELVYAAKPTEEQLKAAEVIVGNVEFPALKQTPKLKVLQLCTAGADGYCQVGIVPDGAVLTNATGAFGLALAEYALATIMAMQKHLYEYHDDQKAKIWGDQGEVKSIFRSKVVIIGLGDIGSELGKRLYALGATVWGIKRRMREVPEYIEKMGTLEDMKAFVSQADIVVNVLPGSPATTNIFTKEIFEAMPKGSLFVNIGRGSAVVEEELYNALVSGHLAGAAIDVAQVEPLPQDSKLWHAPNLHITPHTAGQFHLPATQDFIIDIAIENIQRLQEGKELRNVVDYATGYCK